MYKLALAVLCLAASARAAPEQPRDLVCDICVDIIQDIDDFLTSDTTEQEIIDFVEGVSNRARNECSRSFKLYNHGESFEALVMDDCMMTTY